MVGRELAVQKAQCVQGVKREGEEVQCEQRVKREQEIAVEQ